MVRYKCDTKGRSTVARMTGTILLSIPFTNDYTVKRKRKLSDSRVMSKRKVRTQKRNQKFDNTAVWTNLGRSVGVTTVTKLVWITWFTGQTFRLPATAMYQNDMHLRNCKETSLHRHQTNNHTKHRGHTNRYKNSKGNNIIYQNPYI